MEMCDYLNIPNVPEERVEIKGVTYPKYKKF